MSSGRRMASLDEWSTSRLAEAKPGRVHTTLATAAKANNIDLGPRGEGRGLKYIWNTGEEQKVSPTRRDKSTEDAADKGPHHRPSS